jgi:hypothetical protein
MGERDEDQSRWLAPSESLSPETGERAAVRAETLASSDEARAE